MRSSIHVSHTNKEFSMALFKKKKETVTNEFNQTIEGTSLSKEAWKRLRKNKLAVFGMIVVIIYAILALSADYLPIYPYDEAVTDHKNLPPSLTRTSGDLMLESKLKDLYFKAWKSRQLLVGDEADAQINAWIAEGKSNQVWNYLYEEGERQRAEGTFTFNASDQKQIDKTLDKIENDILISLSKIYYPVDGKLVDLKKADYDTLVPIYAAMIGADTELVETSLLNEIRTIYSNSLKASDSTLEGETLESAIDVEMEALGEDGVKDKAAQNVYGYIEQLAKREAEKRISALNSDGSMSFPYKGELELDNGTTVKVEATKMHERRYYLGTDYLGRDLLSRIIYGCQVSIAIGLVGTITSVFIGIFVGALAGYIGGKVDYYLMRFVDIMYGLPYMLLVIICMAIFGRNILNLFLALALVSWLTIARMVRGQIMSLKNQEYVEAARSMGASTLHIIFRHMIPNSLSVIIVYSTIRIPNFIMQESFLSFLGLGVQAPYASLGSLIGDGVGSMTLYPWKLIFPSIAMVLFLFAMNFLGDGLRDAFDPQSKNQL